MSAGTITSRGCGTKRAALLTRYRSEVDVAGVGEGRAMGRSSWGSAAARRRSSSRQQGRRTVCTVALSVVPEVLSRGKAASDRESAECDGAR